MRHTELGVVPWRRSDSCHADAALMWASSRDYAIIATLLLSVPVRRVHRQDRAGTPLLGGDAIAKCMRSACNAEFNWRCWRASCAVCGLLMCSDCVSEKVTVGGKACAACKLCAGALAAVAAKS